MKCSKGEIDSAAAHFRSSNHIPNWEFLHTTFYSKQRSFPKVAGNVEKLTKRLNDQKVVLIWKCSEWFE